MRTIDVERCDASCPWFHSNRHHQALCLFSGLTMNAADIARIHADAIPFPRWCRLGSKAPRRNTEELRALIRSEMGQEVSRIIKNEMSTIANQMDIESMHGRERIDVGHVIAKLRALVGVEGAPSDDFACPDKGSVAGEASGSEADERG